MSYCSYICAKRSQLVSSGFGLILEFPRWHLRGTQSSTQWKVKFKKEMQPDGHTISGHPFPILSNPPASYHGTGRSDKSNSWSEMSSVTTTCALDYSRWVYSRSDGRCFANRNACTSQKPEVCHQSYFSMSGGWFSFPLALLTWWRCPASKDRLFLNWWYHSWPAGAQWHR